MIDNSIVKLVKKKVFSLYYKKEVNAIVLFGSRARGDFDEDSDYDINVFVDKTKDYGKNLLFRNKEIYIDFINKKKFRYLFDKSHSHLYCTFRDGIIIYQRNKWFDNIKNDILKLKPSKEMVLLYLDSSFRALCMLKRSKKFGYYDAENGKIASNQIGFAIMMHNKKYPKSPHTLSKEILFINNRYKVLIKTIFYLQETYYSCKNRKISVYFKKIDYLFNFVKSYIIKNFPNNINKIKIYQDF